jgi:hypothetical protein
LPGSYVGDWLLPRKVVWVHPHINQTLSIARSAEDDYTGTISSHITSNQCQLTAVLASTIITGF